MAIGAAANLLLIGGGTAAVVLATRKAEGSVIRPAVATPPPAKTTAGARIVKVASVAGAAGLANPYLVGGTQAGTSEAQALRAAQDKIRAEYNRLSAEAKKTGAKAINSALGTNLTGNESFSDAAAIIGAAGGNAGCAAVGIPPNPYCAMAGAYLGKKIGEYLDGAWDDVKDWASDQWTDAKDWVEDQAEDLWDSTLGRWI
jgi:hypothetical protein